MAQWRIKEISLMTGLSVRMLHHYDKIGLLKPSLRLPNGYRWYSERDLARLQQIVALKFFGFGLVQIKTMLQQAPGIYEHLQSQQQMLADQTEYLQKVQDALATVLEQNKASADSLDWNSLVLLIERYRMLDTLKGTWVGKLNKEQQDRYVAFKQAYHKEVSAWEEAIEQINSGKLGNPEGLYGEQIAKLFLNMNRAQVKWEAATKTSQKITKADAAEVLETIKEFKLKAIPLGPEGNVWFAKALAAHRLRSWEQLHQAISNNLDVEPSSDAGKKLAQEWRDLVTDHCMGATNDFFLGMMLLMESARVKAELNKQEELKPVRQIMAQEITSDAKMLQDPLAMDWISKALKVH